MIFNLQSWFWVLRKGSYKVQCHFPSGAHFTCFIYWALRIMVFFLKILSCVLQIDFLQQYFGILSYNFTYEWHTGYWTKIWSHIRSIKSISGDVKDSIYCEHHVKSVLHLIGMDQIKFCIRSCGIHFTFMFYCCSELWHLWLPLLSTLFLKWIWPMRFLFCRLYIAISERSEHVYRIIYTETNQYILTAFIGWVYKTHCIAAIRGEDKRPFIIPTICLYLW